jgi:hypothetical protein
MTRAIVAIVAFLVLVGAWASHAAVMRAPSGRWPALAWPSITKIQRAGSGRAMVSIMRQLGPEGRARLGIALVVVDVLIIAGYVTLLVCGALASTDVVRDVLKNHETARQLGVDLSEGVIVLAAAAGVCDVVENVALAVALHRWPANVEGTTGTELEDARREAARTLENPAKTAQHATNTKWVLLALVLVWLAATATVALSD